MTQKNKTALTPEWSRKVEAATVEDTPLSLRIEATAQERKDVARRLKVSEISQLNADITLKREEGSHIIHVEGTLQAEVVQPCVVTLEPVVSLIQEPVESWYSDEEQIVSLTRVRREKVGKMVDSEMEIMDEKDDPDPVVEGHIDVGELVTQFLSLAINPYPQAEGAVYTETSIPTEPPKRANPFAGLKDWKARRSRGKEEKS